MNARRDSKQARGTGESYDRVITLLPMRNEGPPTDISTALDALLVSQRPQAMYVPNLPSVAEQIKPRESDIAIRPAERRAPTSAEVSRVYKDPVVSGAPARVSPQRVRAGVPAGPVTASTLGRGKHMLIDRSGEVSASERVRFRNSITTKLMDLYEEAVELDECSQNMVAQVADAMRADPRRAKEVNGRVRLASYPTRVQEEALAAVVKSMTVLREACVELAASYLTPEEKRFLGVDTSLFQTRAERATAYQYDPKLQQKQSQQARADERRRRKERDSGVAQAAAEPKAEKKAPEPTAADSLRAAAAAAPEEAPASAFVHSHHTSERRSTAPTSLLSRTGTPVKPPTPPPPASVPPVVERHTESAAPAPPPPAAPPVVPPPVAAPPPAVTESAQAGPPPLPSPVAAASPPLSDGGSDTHALGTPERQRAPVNTSLSSLGGVLPTSTGGMSPTRPTAEPKRISSIPPGFRRVLSPAKAPVKAIPKAMPAGARIKQPPGTPGALVKQQPPAVTFARSEPQSQGQPSSVAAPRVGGQPIASLATPSSASANRPAPTVPPAAPPTATGSTATSAARRASAVRAEFRRFMVDTDSESNA